MKALIAFAAATFSASALAAPETYVFDNNHTFPRFSYSHLGYSIQMSRFDRTRGRVVWDKAARTAIIEAVIDMTSVNTGSKVFDGHIQGPDYLDTARFPTATFKSTAVRFEGDKPVAIDGDLTIKGVTKPVTLAVTHFHAMPHPMLKREAIGANATGKVRRSEFNAGKHAPDVGDEVTITLAIEAVRE